MAEAAAGGRALEALEKWTMVYSGSTHEHFYKRSLKSSVHDDRNLGVILEPD